VGHLADPDLELIRSVDPDDVEGVVAALAPDCVYHEDPNWLDGRVVRGRAEIEAILDEYREIWGTSHQQVERVERVGAAIVATIRHRGITPRGEMPVDQVWTYVFRVRDGEIAEMWAFADPDDARRKAAAVT
jgi:ketosteroid isomerase-like protein